MQEAEMVILMDLGRTFKTKGSDRQMWSAQFAVDGDSVDKVLRTLGIKPLPIETGARQEDLMDTPLYVHRIFDPVAFNGHEDAFEVDFLRVEVAGGQVLGIECGMEPVADASPGSLEAEGWTDRFTYCGKFFVVWKDKH